MGDDDDSGSKKKNNIEWNRCRWRAGGRANNFRSFPLFQPLSAPFRPQTWIKLIVHTARPHIYLLICMRERENGTEDQMKNENSLHDANSQVGENRKQWQRRHNVTNNIKYSVSVFDGEKKSHIYIKRKRKQWQDIRSEEANSYSILQCKTIIQILCVLSIILHPSGICNWESFSSLHSSSSRTFECSTRASLAATHCRCVYIHQNISKLGAIFIIRLISAVQISSIPRQPPQCVVVPLLYLAVSIIHSVIIIGPEDGA